MMYLPGRKQSSIVIKLHSCLKLFTALQWPLQNGSGGASSCYSWGSNYHLVGAKPWKGQRLDEGGHIGQADLSCVDKTFWGPTHFCSTKSLNKQYHGADLMAEPRTVRMFKNKMRYSKSVRKIKIRSMHARSMKKKLSLLLVSLLFPLE